MNEKELLQFIKSEGFKEYLEGQNTRCFSLREIDGPDYDCNDRPPEFHLKYYNFVLPNGDYHKSLALEVVGESNNSWLNLQIYSISLEELEEVLPKAKKALTEMWKVGHKVFQ